MTQVTQILDSLGQSDGERAASELLPLVYQELHRLAVARLANEQPGQSIETTDLVHEAYLRLVGKEGELSYSGRAHFFGAAAEAMRRIMIERARKRQTLRRGGDLKRAVVAPDQLASAPDQADERLLQLHVALEKLESVDPRKAQIVKLRFFAGLTTREIADMLSMSTATIERSWKFARAWLRTSTLHQDR